jgi:dihydrofolate reductase
MIHFVVAYTTNRLIGNDNKMPWHLPDDLRHFKELTTGKTVVMGRQTFESIGKPLPQRRNVVLTRQTDFHYPGIEIVHQLDDILQIGDIYVIGGAQIFKALIDVVDRMHITELHTILSGDTFFPEWDKDDFCLVSNTPGVVNEKNRIPHTFYVYNRIHSANRSAEKERQP